MFKDNLKTIIKKKGISQKDLAINIGVKPNTVSDWINLGKSPKLEHLYQISDYLNVSLDWLLKYPLDKNLETINSDEESELLFCYNQINTIKKAMLIERAKTLLELENIENESTKNSKALKIAEPSLGSTIPNNSDIEMLVYDQAASAGFGNYLDNNITHEILKFNANEIPYNADFGIRIKGDSMEPDISDNEIVWIKEQNQIENGQIGIFVLNDEAFCKRLEIDHKNHAVYLLSSNENYKPIKITKSDAIRTIGRVLL